MKQAVPIPKKITTTAQEPSTPADLQKALRAKPAVAAAWKDLTPISRRDFITWIEGAKLQETRTRRIGIACDKLAKGERRPCCYAVVPMHLYKALGTNPKAKATWSTLSPDERRDFADWVDAAPDKLIRTERIEKICAGLASGVKKMR